MSDNKDCIDELVKNNLKLVTYAIKKYYPQHIGDDDAFQLGCMGLMKAAKNYDESKGAFSTYSILFIRGAINASIRYKYANKRKCDLEIASLDYVVSEVGNQTKTLHEICGDKSFEEDAINNQMIRELLASTDLKDTERQCLNMYYFEGFNQVEISNILGMPNVSRAINNALSKLRKNALMYVS